MQPFPAGSWCKSVLRRSFPALVLASLGLPALAQAPVALFTTDPNPAEGGAPLAVQFIDQSTGNITSWQWDFGDGGPGSSAQNPLQVFTLVQPFDVTLTVSGPQGVDSFTLLHAVDVLPTINGVVGAPPSLATMAVPVPDDLAQFVSDPEAVVRLGKALFWDVQVGSDGMTACASCHYHAGVDNRPRNTIHPGADGVFDLLPSQKGGGPNYTLSSGDFPFHKFVLPNTGTDLIRSTDDRRGATGVLAKDFAGTDPSGTFAFDFAKDGSNPSFQVGGIDTLQATGRDAPTAIGAIFFHRLFWDGRASNFFNGKNIWGNTDPSEPRVLEMLADGSLGEIAVLLDDAAAASQAIGPPLSSVEMSWTGRSWEDLGRKLVVRRPLSSQTVDLADGVLGALANPAGPGLEPALTYADLIRSAFHQRWWGSSELRGGFTQMEANFALFFGLAIQAYEATLVPGNAPYDRWAEGDLTALSDSALRGLELFVGRGLCTNCHGTPMFAGGLRDEVLSPDAPGEGILERMPMATAIVEGGGRFRSDSLGTRIDGRVAGLYDPQNQLVAWLKLPAGVRCAPAGSRVIAMQPTALVPPGSEFVADLRFVTDGRCNMSIDFRFAWNELGPPPGNYELRLAGKRMRLSIAPALTAVYDNGFYNIGVTPSSDDPGVGGRGPFGPLSVTRRVQEGDDIGQPTGLPGVAWFERTAVDGAFKTPTLRNVELTGPYMHNGSMATLEQVIEFYARGGNFAAQNARDLDPDVGGFALSEQEKGDLVAFLESLTDPRVRFEQAPFDHPELPLKEGQVGDHQSVFDDGQGNAIPVLTFKPATGFTGGNAIPPFAARLPAFVTVAVIEEGAAGARIGITCDKEPSASVSVFLSLSNPAIATLSPAVVTFTPDDWRVGRIVTVTTLDPDSAGGSTLTLHTSRAQSSDPAFASLPVDDVVLDFVPNLITNTDGSGQPTTDLAPGGASAAGKRL
ncbi:MAG TPA: cytochrome c peroxidase [Planctomycetota bacterium]